MAKIFLILSPFIGLGIGWIWGNSFFWGRRK